ncbi:HNH endonuclease [Virgibacillus pantothenticus]|uniref:Putative HNH nuclease YajD n=1 Tax=Virgibacillus pantothenticus TaxID=1473 RepID=A0A0L0QM40_VIRPA|nr:HNH endonuclease signature motif containing protein [Virgibacillus pantothenticus]KNE19662.1 endonuclease [Virgibacillus pantothenticus]MED3736634.1 HNH endonuclease signature motif containing protein [Virgibacillus pantothenticus]QTY14809.1 HNH endonuclease [Virgibacillus pantothenticus]SIS79479.1 HNH endonuclease [Virgibacillus pantothenticus]
MSNHNLYDKYKRSKEDKKFLNSAAWIRCRTLALIRDHYLCQHCLRNKIIKLAEMVHHIKPRDEYPELALTLDNLISLCNACHNKEHPERGGGKRKKTKKRKINVVEFGANEEIR